MAMDPVWQRFGDFDSHRNNWVRYPVYRRVSGIRSRSGYIYLPKYHVSSQKNSVIPHPKQFSLEIWRYKNPSISWYFWYNDPMVFSIQGATPFTVRKTVELSGTLVYVCAVIRNLRIDTDSGTRNLNFFREILCSFFGVKSITGSIPS